MDLAGLIVKLTPQGIKETTDQLKKFSREAGKAEDAAQKLENGGKEAGQAMYEFGAKVDMLSGGPLMALKAGLIALPIGIVAGKLAQLGKSIVTTGMEFEVLSRQIQAVMGSESEAARALEWIDEFTLKTPLQVEEVAQAFNMLKAIGIDPMNGSLQALVDASSFTAQGFEGLMGITRQMGQAWAKDRLAGEEILRLRERMVPVFDLLADKMGKSTKEIQKMSEAGDLTREHILLLFEAMGEKYAGAAAIQMDTLAGKISNLQQAWTFAMRELASSGALEGVKQAVDALADSLQSAMDTGLIDSMARGFGKFVASASIALQEVIASFTAFKLVIKTTTQAFLDMLAGMEDKIAGLRTNLLATGYGPLAGLGELLAPIELMSSGATNAARAMQPEIDALTEQLANQTAAILKNKAELAAWTSGQYAAAQAVEKTGQETEKANKELEDQAAIIAAGSAKIQTDMQAANDDFVHMLHRTIEPMQQFSLGVVAVQEFGGEIEELPTSFKDGIIVPASQAAAKIMLMGDEMTDAEKAMKSLGDAALQFSNEFQQGIVSMFGGTLRGLLEGEMDDFGDFILTALTDLGQMAGESFINQMVTAMFSKDVTAAQAWDSLFGEEGTMKGAPGAIAGAGMMAGGFAQGGAQGAISGGLGGATFAAALGAGPWGIAAAGLGAAILSMFGGKDEEPPRTMARYIGPGAAWQGGAAGIWTRDQGMTAEQDRVASLAIGSTYREINEQWRDLTREFKDLELWDFLRDMPTIINETFEDMDVREFQTYLAEDKLPTMFRQTYGKILRRGLRNLGFAGEAFDNLMAEIRDMPGTERIEGLTALVRALRDTQELLTMDFDELSARAGENFMDEFLRWTGEAGEAMDNLTGGWDEMNITERAQDLEQIGQIFQDVTENTIQMLRQLDAMSRTLKNQFDALIEDFTTRGMSDEELWGYLEGRYNYYKQLMETTDDPNLILEYSQRMIDIMSQASGLLTDEQWLGTAGDTGMTFQEWFTQLAEGAQAAADAALEEQRTRIENVYNSLYDQLEVTRQEFVDLAGTTDPVTTGFGNLGDAALDLEGAFRRVEDVINNFPGLADGGNTAKSATLEANIVVEAPDPPVVNVTVAGSLAALEPMISAAVQRRTVAIERRILSAIS
jgi:tape measure domain-containing protein